ncbi:hypothetical protein KZX37_09120 [Microbacterium sp. EYE_5]|uniref:hypothetical protein n=1 Tax=unclassified Microbacterium TaxID=2609290 RepID=UPI002006844D|nr:MULTISPECIES: hypothetical protein [unclassified Microbacterium]MCK6081324.1 hypothetical protein [Microbacterium sp. EYE_382]MCK6086594.1 hypothetical protein [Microbacterium sp. EYE_384]MCK6123908.1 hypothetical protein [Microbacterium sp. EYE_80]MCK6126817.1 hypothetical protein [Microbacterium sp. EYE_79]MCK6142279.1 hypothetical protein [Microbacterium sp. EYE_39]
MVGEIVSAVAEVFGAVLSSAGGPRRVFCRSRLVDGQGEGLTLGEEVGGEATVSVRRITLGDVRLRGVVVGALPLRMSYLDEIDQRAEVFRIEWDGGVGEWTLPAVRARTVLRWIGA